MEDCSKRTVTCEFCKRRFLTGAIALYWSLLIFRQNNFDFRGRNSSFQHLSGIQSPLPQSMYHARISSWSSTSPTLSLASALTKENSDISVAKALGQRMPQTGSFVSVLWLWMWISWSTNGDHATHEGIAGSAFECCRKNHCHPEETLASLRRANEWTEEMDWTIGATSECSGQDLRRPIYLETGSLPGRAKHREDFLSNVGWNLCRNDWRKQEPTRRPLCQVHHFSPVDTDTDWLSPFVYVVMDEVRTEGSSEYRQSIIRFLSFSQRKIRFLIHLHLSWWVRCFTCLAILASGDIHPTGSVWRYRQPSSHYLHGQTQHVQGEQTISRSAYHRS